MALAKKGSRKIVVDGREFRWLVSGNDGWLELVIERWKAPRGRLVAGFDYHSYVVAEHESTDSSGWVGKSYECAQARIVTPGVVAQVVRAALQSGWDPNARGQFGLAGEALAAAPEFPPGRVGLREAVSRGDRP